MRRERDLASEPLLYFGADSENDPRGSLYFVKRAFHETERQAVVVVPHTSDQPLSLEQARAATLFIVTTGLSEEQARVMREQPQLKFVGHFDPRVLQQRSDVVGRRPQHGVLKVDQAEPPQAVAVGEPVQVRRVEVA